MAAGAALWGTDAVFRRQLALEMPASTLVFLEHLVLVAVTAPFLWRFRAQLRKLTKTDWLAAVVIGAGSSTLATVLFTSAFRYGNPTTPLLLQKVQPIVAVLAARLLLGERLLPRFAWFLASGLAGAYLIAFRDPLAVSVSAMTPALLALGAAALWGLGTVLGRRLSSPLSFQALTALRFSIGLPMAGLIMRLTPDATAALGEVGFYDARAVILLALVPGLAALMLYYLGLRSTPASAATLAELSFPLTAAGLNYVVFGTVLSRTQIAGTVLLASTIAAMTVLARRGSLAIGIRRRPVPLPSEA